MLKFVEVPGLSFFELRSGDRRDRFFHEVGRAVHGRCFTPPTASGIFADVPLSYWAADWIEQLYREGITTGCQKNPLMYCPEMHVTRAQMAKFLARMLGL